jgi:8-oxo-dGTP diphosphatase
MKVVAGIIERPSGEVLLAQRPEGKALAGWWEFPGGKIESQETPEQALHRELREELQLDVRIVRALGVFPFDYESGAIDLHVFHVRPMNQPEATLEVQAFRWLNPREIPRADLAPADIAPLDAFIHTLTP